MKTTIVIVILAAAAVALAVALLAVKKSGEEQHATDTSSIADLSKQVVDADLKINDLNSANIGYSNDLVLSHEQSVQLSNSLAAASVALGDSQKAIAAAHDQIASDNSQITNLTARIGDLETENHALDQRAGELTNTIAQLNSLIEDTRRRLNTSETNNAFLQQALQQQMAQKAEIEHKFNDLDELRQQVKKIKDDLYIARRLQLMKNDSSQKKGAQLLMERSVPATSPSAAPGYGLNVEVGSDGSVKVIPPLGASTNAPAH